MAKRMEIYKCEACGNIVEVLHGGEGDLARSKIGCSKCVGYYGRGVKIRQI